MQPTRITRRALCAIAAIASLAIALAGCGTPGGGDPGNARLHTLEHDPVVTALPPDSRRYPTPLVNGAPPPHTQLDGALQVQPAWWDSSYHMWRGIINVTSEFTSSLPVAGVFGFYAHLAARNGWKAGPTNYPAVESSYWTKTYPSGYYARFGVTIGGQSTEPPPRGLYNLGANIVPFGSS